MGFRLHWKDWNPDKGVLAGLRAGLIVTVWFYAFAINTFGWRNAGINNVLIFEFDPRNYLTFQKLFEVKHYNICSHGDNLYP